MNLRNREPLPALSLGPRALLLMAAALLLLSAPATAQRLRDKKKPRNDPVQDPYTKGDPAAMAKAGYTSMGGFEFARSTTAGVDEYMATDDIKWISTEHFELGIGLPQTKVTIDEKAKIRAEMARLAERLPDIPLKPRTLDPWLRAHLYAMRLEDMWDEMVELLDVGDVVWPDGKTLWDTTPPYLGQGPYLGEKGKYEILLLPSEGSSVDFLTWQFGLAIKLTQRYNTIERDSLILIAHTQQGGLKVDEALHGHVAFNISQLLLNGYKHYSYDIPIWIKEGIAHWMERRINPDFNTFDSSEGAIAEMTRKANWEPPTRKLVAASKAPGMAQLMAIKDYGSLRLEHHFATWSMIDYLTREHPGFLAKLLGGIKGRTDENGVDDGSDLDEVHRTLFRGELGIGYLQFDRAWKAWVLANYSTK